MSIVLFTGVCTYYIYDILSMFHWKTYQIMKF